MLLLDVNVGGIIPRFADTGICGIVDLIGCPRIQRGADEREDWPEQRQTGFNPGKREVMHIGKTNSKGTVVQ